MQHCFDYDILNLKFEVASLIFGHLLEKLFEFHLLGPELGGVEGLLLNIITK